MNNPIRAKILRHINHARLMASLGYCNQMSLELISTFWPLREKINQRGKS